MMHTCHYLYSITAQKYSLSHIDSMQFNQSAVNDWSPDRLAENKTFVFIRKSLNSLFYWWYSALIGEVVEFIEVYVWMI